MSDADEPAVVNDPDHDRYVFEHHGSVAELIYRVKGDRLVLVHTEVPGDLAGRGIGGGLVRAAVQRAAAAGLTVVPWCPYARAWLEDHRQIAGTVTIDWTPPPGS